MVYPKILLEAFHSRHWVDNFFGDWKNQRMVLLRKGGKSLDKALSYRPISLLGTIGKLLEEWVLQKFQTHMQGENSLSKNQFSFRKGRSTFATLQAVMDIATKSSKRTGKRKKFCVLISVDIRNAINCTRWKNCIEPIMRKKIPDYLLRMIDKHLSDR